MRLFEAFSPQNGRHRHIYRSSALGGGVDLQQPQPFPPFDGLQAAVGVQLAVDALGVGADGLDGDHQGIGDFGDAQAGLHAAQHVQFTAGQRLRQRRQGSLAGGSFLAGRKDLQ